MRDYLAPAKKMVARVVPQPMAVRAFVAQRKAPLFFIVASVVVVTMLSFVTARALVTTQTERSVDTDGQHATLSTTTTTQDQPPAAEVDTTDQTSQPSETKINTTVTVNNQAVEVPQNGTTQKTIVSGDGTTTNVTVSSNAESDGSTSTNTYTSTNSNTSVFSNTSSQNVNISSSQ